MAVDIQAVVVLHLIVRLIKIGLCIDCIFGARSQLITCVLIEPASPSLILFVKTTISLIHKIIRSVSPSVFIVAVGVILFFDQA